MSTDPGRCLVGRVACFGMLLSIGLVSAGCASITEAPAPVVLTTTPHIVDSTPSPGPYAPTVSAGAGWAEAPLPPLPLAIRFNPRRPRQASVVSVLILEPPGPALDDPEASLAGFDVPLVRNSRGWVGVGVLPLDSAGVFTLEVSGRRAGLPVLERRALWVDGRVYPSTRIRISAGGASDPEVDARIARERELIESRLTAYTPEWLPDGTFDWPRPLVRTSPFGERRVFNGSVRSRHLGLDLRGRRGQPAYAAAAGRVVLTGRFFYQGNAVYVDHGLGVVTAYFHFTSIEVAEGEHVAAGQLLGRVGSTGRSTAPHLHWSAYVNGVNVDPESLIGFRLSPRAETAETTSDESLPESTN